METQDNITRIQFVAKSAKAEPDTEGDFFCQIFSHLRLFMALQHIPYMNDYVRTIGLHGVRYYGDLPKFEEEQFFRLFPATLEQRQKFKEFMGEVHIKFAPKGKGCAGTLKPSPSPLNT